MDATTAATNVVVAVVAAGGFTAVRDGVRAHRVKKAAKTPEGRERARISVADATLALVAKARDEFEEDNSRLRSIIGEERVRHAEDREQWAREKAALRAEIDALEAKLRLLLSEVEALRTRAGH